MKDGDQVKAVKGEFIGKIGVIVVTIHYESIDLPNSKGVQAGNAISHFVVREKDDSIFPALESELEIIT